MRALAVQGPAARRKAAPCASGEREEFARTLHGLGQASEMGNRFVRAMELLRHALTIQESEFGNEHPQVATTLTNMGLLNNRMGEPDAALEVLARAERVKERFYGLHHESFAYTQREIGKALCLKREPAGALVRHQRALAILEGLFVPDHPEVAVTLFHLSEAEEALGNLSAGREHRARALDILRNRLGEHHSSTMKVRKSLEAMTSNQNTGNER